MTSPDGFFGWLALITLLINGVFKLDRGRILYRRSQFFDSLGRATIAYDWYVGAAYLLIALMTIVPALTHLRGVIYLVAIPVVVWTWWTVRRASRTRIHKAMAGVGAPMASSPPDEDRRQTVRRQVDKDRDARLDYLEAKVAEYEQG